MSFVATSFNKTNIIIKYFHLSYFIFFNNYLKKTFIIKLFNINFYKDNNSYDYDKNFILKLKSE